jgi:NADH-quinone oxidoreductase subunit M
MSAEALLLSVIIFLPSLAALVVLPFFPKNKPDAMKLFSLFTTIVVFLLTLWMALPRGAEGPETRFAVGDAAMQMPVSEAWIPSFDIFYQLGVDGISFPLVILTSFLSVLSMWASWPIEKNVRAYCMLFLILETGMLGVFMALDFFLFFVFWEVMLLPMYFLIGVWGGPRREYAALKFFLYTLLGGVFMLIAILMLYFASDMRELQRVSPDSIARAGLADSETLKSQLAVESSEPIHTFNLLALAEMGQHTKLFSGEFLWGHSLQWWAFLLLLIGFVIKVPSVPVHTWLPDAHVEAPTPISMILAGVLLKMGGYGIIRICYPICPEAGYDLAWFVTGLGVLSMVYGAFAALAQKDFKRLVAYSSVSHMGYVVLGLGVWSATADNMFNPDYWKMGMNGAMFQMIAHGISSAGMFFMVGVLYERVHHRNLNEFGGIFARMPVYAGLAIPIFFAGLGLPGLCGFIGEVFVTLSVWNYSQAMAVISASVVVLTAAYILWTIQRVYLGPEYKGPHGDHLYPMTAREMAIAIPLVVLAIVFGVYPRVVLDYMEPSVSQEVTQMADWAAIHRPKTEEASTDETQQAAFDPTAVDNTAVDNTAVKNTANTAARNTANTAARNTAPLLAQEAR